MSTHNSHQSSPQNQFEHLGQQNDHHHENSDHHHHQEVVHLHEHHTATGNLDQHTFGVHHEHEPLEQHQIHHIQHTHLTEPVEQLINQQIPSENLQPNNHFIGNPMFDSTFKNGAENALPNPNVVTYAQGSQIAYASVPVYAAPAIIQSRAIVSPHRYVPTASTLQTSTRLMSPTVVRPKKMETQVKYEPYEKSVIQYEEVEKTIVELQPVEKKIKVRVPVEKKVTDYRKCEYLVPADEEKDGEEVKAAAATQQVQQYPVYSNLVSSTKRTFTSPSIPLQSRLVTSTINLQPYGSNNIAVNTVKPSSSTVLLQSQVIRQPYIVQQVPQRQINLNQATTTTKVSASKSVSSQGVTPRNITSPKGAATTQTKFFSTQTIQQAKQVGVPLQTSVSFAKPNLVRTQPFLNRSVLPAASTIYPRQTTTALFANSGSFQNKPLWGYFNDRVINNSKTTRFVPQPYLRQY